MLQAPDILCTSFYHWSLRPFISRCFETAQLPCFLLVEIIQWLLIVYSKLESGSKEHGVQWQLNRSYNLTCTPGHIAAQFNWQGNCTTVVVDTVVLGKFQAACVSKITIGLTTFLPCSLMNKTESVADVLQSIMSNAAAPYVVPC